MGLDDFPNNLFTQSGFLDLPTDYILSTVFPYLDTPYYHQLGISESTGEYTHARENRLGINFIDSTGRLHLCEFSKHGALLCKWEIDGTPILFEPISFANFYDLEQSQGDTMRGGAMTAYPHNSLNREHDSPYFHGTLPRMLAQPIVTDYEKGEFIFVLNHTCTPRYSEFNNAITLIGYKFMDDGTLVHSVQTVNLGDEAIHLNTVYHPYLNVEYNYVHGIQVGNQTISTEIVENSEKDPVKHTQNIGSLLDVVRRLSRGVFEKANNSITLLTNNFNFTVTPLAGFDPESGLGVWTEKLRRFFCVEVVQGHGHKYTSVAPQTSHTSAVSYSVQT